MQKHAAILATTADASVLEEIFAASDFNGRIGSIDTANAGVLKCANWASMNHKGRKLSIPSRTRNVATTH